MGPAHVKVLSAQEIDSLALRGKKMSCSLNLEHSQSSAKYLTKAAWLKLCKGNSAITAIECLFDPVNITS